MSDTDFLLMSKKKKIEIEISIERDPYVYDRYRVLVNGRIHFVGDAQNAVIIADQQRAKTHPPDRSESDRALHRITN